MALAGCGNNGGGSAAGSAGTGGGGSTPTAATPRLEVFQASLLAIDPSDPTTIIDLDPLAADVDEESSFFSATPVVAGTWVDGTVFDPRVEEVVYPRQDGTLARVSTDLSSGTPTPRRLGADTLPELVCDVVIGPDLADFEATRFLFAGAHRGCSEPLAYRAVTLSDDDATESRVFPGTPITFLVDRTTGAHTGWLALDDAGDLGRLDADLNTAAAGLLVGAVRGAALGVTKDGLAVLEVDQRLYTFDPETNTLSDDLFEFGSACPCDLRFATDGELAFVNDESELFRIDLGSGDVVSIDAPADAAASFGFFFLPSFVLVGETRVAWSYTADADGNAQTFDDISTVWRSVAKDGSDAFTVDSLDLIGAQTLTFLPFLPTVVGDRLFYNAVRRTVALPTVEAPLQLPSAGSDDGVFPLTNDAYGTGGAAANGGTRIAGAGSADIQAANAVQPAAQEAESIQALAIHRDLVSSGSTPVVREDALWVGSSAPAALTLSSLGSVRRLHRITGVPDLSEFGQTPGKVDLESFDAANPSAPEVPLGELPSDTFYAASLPGIGPGRLGIAFADDGRGGFLPDILYWNDEETGSLVRVTETPDVAEVPVGLF